MTRTGVAGRTLRIWRSNSSPSNSGILISRTIASKSVLVTKPRAFREDSHVWTIKLSVSRGKYFSKASSRTTSSSTTKTCVVSISYPNQEQPSPDGRVRVKVASTVHCAPHPRGQSIHERGSLLLLAVENVNEKRLI